MLRPDKCDWSEVCLSIPRERVAVTELALQELGAVAVTLLDQADHPVLEPAPGTAPLWPVVRICGLFPAEVNRLEVSQALINVTGVDRPDALSWAKVADQDWERAWMDRFQPMRFGKHLWIVPSGMESPEDERAVLLHLDPGLAFGTGTHPTTALCLQWIDEWAFTGDKVVDYGCGSGVLGIACALKGANDIVCVDNDPQALEATRANAKRNDVSMRITCQAPECYKEKQSDADVVIANILAGPLIALAPVLLNSLRPGGHVVLSGILEEQADSVIHAYQENCENISVTEHEGWVRINAEAQ